MPQYVVRRVTAALNADRKAVNGARIVVLGVSYKPDVGNTRESPAVPVVEQLVGLGAEVVAIDPRVSGVDRFAGAPLRTEVDDELLVASDLVLLLTDHAEFDYPQIVELAPRMLDTRNRLRGHDGEVERL